MCEISAGGATGVTCDVSAPVRLPSDVPDEAEGECVRTHAPVCRPVGR